MSAVPSLLQMSEAPRDAGWVNLWYDAGGGFDGINIYPVAAHYADTDGDGLMPPAKGWFRWAGYGAGFTGVPADPIGWTPVYQGGSGDASTAFGHPVEGFGASYNRDTNSWSIYSIAGGWATSVATVPGASRRRVEWIINALRAANGEEAR